MSDESGTVLPAIVAAQVITDKGSGATLAGAIVVGVLGQGLKVKTGANGKRVQNAGPLVAGALVVANTSVTADSLVKLVSRGDGGAVGFLYENRAARVVGVSFAVVSSNGADVQHFDYEISEPA